MAVLDHHRVVEHGHIRHSAVAVPRIQIRAKYGVLLGRGYRRAHLRNNISVAIEDAPHAAGWAEIVDHHAHRDAGTAILASRPIGDGLAAAEAAMGQQVIQLRGALAHKMRKHLALLLSWQVGARRRCGEVELWSVAGVLRQSSLAAWETRTCAGPKLLHRCFVVKPAAWSRVPPAGPLCGSALPVIDHDCADKHIVQQTPPLVEKRNQKNERRQKGYCYPIDNRMSCTEEKISR